MSFTDTLAFIEANRNRALSGDYNCIPWGLPRFEKYAPGLEKAKYYIVTANTKVGKTQFTDYMFLYNPLNYVKSHPELDIKLKVVYISMEMTKQEKILQAISRKLYIDSRGKVRLSPTQIKSVGRNNLLPEEILQKIKEYHEYFEVFEDIIEIIDDTRNSYGIYNKVREISKEFSADYALKLRNNYGFSIAAIQQQSADQEGLERFKEAKLEPSLDGMGDNKLTSRDANQIFSIFSPARHHLPYYKGYDINRLGDHFRTLSILGGRDGGAGVMIPVYFDGAVNYMREMPSPKYNNEKKLINSNELEVFYKKAETNYSN